jgi:hypothetical protein
MHTRTTWLCDVLHACRHEAADMIPRNMHQDHTSVQSNLGARLCCAAVRPLNS